jgi:uncharacterized protein
MAISFFMHDLRRHPVRLQGAATVAELELEGLDELVRVVDPVRYDIEAEVLANGVLARGRIDFGLDCQCARCLKPFSTSVGIADWAVLLEFDSEDGLAMASEIADLTPFVREDIVLALPQHPLCQPGCGGLSFEDRQRQGTTDSTAPVDESASVWAVLNRLNL